MLLWNQLLIATVPDFQKSGLKGEKSGTIIFVLMLKVEQYFS